MQIRNEIENNLESRDKLYIQNTHKTNKLSLNFNPTIHMEESSKRPEISVRNDKTESCYKRKTVYLTKVEEKLKMMIDENN